MVILKNTLRILPITADQGFYDLICSILLGKEYQVLEAANKVENLEEQILELKPGFILLDYQLQGADTANLIDNLSLKFPELSIIAVLPQEMISESTAMILAGARAFLVYPFNNVDLLKTLERIRELDARISGVPVEAKPDDKLVQSRGTFVVFSPKGGVGTSSVTINLAIAIHERLDQEILLMDGKFLFGDVDLMLNLRTPNTVSDLIAHVGQLDEALIRDVVTGHVSGIKVLPAPSTASAGQGVRPENLYGLLTELQSVYPFIFIDSGNFLNENVVTFMDAAFKIILVVNPDISSLRNATQFLDICRSLSYPKDKVLVIVNRYDKREGLSLEDIERSLQTRVFGTIPTDHSIALQSINRGIPVVLQRKSTAMSKAFETISKDLVKEIKQKPEVKDSGREKTTPDVLSKSSRLG